MFSPGPWPTGNGRSCVDKAKPFDIPKREVWDAFKKVRANQGAAGVDGQSVSDFEADLSNNLYKLWNRMSSGSYLPPPVRRVDIPKEMAERGRWGFLQSRIASPRKSSGGTWSLSWSPSSMRTHTDTVAAGRRSMRFGKPDSGAGGTTGRSISTSRASSTVSSGSCFSRQSAHTRVVLGASLH